MANDTEIILCALQRERDELHSRILQVDRIIKRVQSIDYDPAIVEPVNKELGQQDNKQIERISETSFEASFPKTADIKIQVLRIFDIVGQAAPLADFQSRFTDITGNTFKIRETVRSLYNVGLVKMLKFKMASRGFMWVKTDWIDNGKLKDQFKPLGFDLLYRPETLMFQ